MGPRRFVLVVLVLLGVWAAPAWASFPGRDGDLVVATDGGLALMNPTTGGSTIICANAVLCGVPERPQFSPNGQAIAFVDRATGRPVVVASDGSCLWCLVGASLTRLTASEVAFVPGGQSVTLARNRLWNVSLTGRRPRRLVRGLGSDAVWSARGVVALVRAGWIWVARPGHGEPRRLVRGDSPSFSPDGARLAFARDGHVRIIAVRGHAGRRLVKGDAPAWSPDGRQIAFIDPGGAVEIIAARGGRARRVGSVHGSALDWQPLPASVSRACSPPRGATVLASSPEAVVYALGANRVTGPHIYGCLTALHRTQPLRNNTSDFLRLVAVRLAGRFAALESEGSHGGFQYDATMYDLGSGAVTPLGEAGDLYSSGGATSALDSLAVDSSGFAAWRETTSVPFPEPISAVSCPSTSLCIAGDWAGDILSATNPTAGSSAWDIASISGSFGPEVTNLSCPSASLCFGLGFFDNALLSSTDPAGGAKAWAQVAIDRENFLDALSCPSASLCVATDVGHVLTSTNPTGGPSAWTKAPIGQDEMAYAISCPSVSLCVATVTQGSILSSSQPTGGATAWQKTQIAQGNVGAVSCPSVSLCLIAGPDGSILTSSDPTGGKSAWTGAPIDQGSNVTAISCPSVSLCVAVDVQGNILTSTDPLSGVASWSKTAVEQGAVLDAISCPSISMCVAADQKGNVLTSTDPTAGANAWTIAAVEAPPCASQPTQCVTDRLYAHDDEGTQAVDTAALGDGNLIGNVTLTGDSLALNWTHGNVPQHLELR